MSVLWRGLDCGAEFRGKKSQWGKKAERVEQSAGKEGQGSEWELESLPSSLVRSSMGVLGGPSPICVNASTSSEYIVYFWRPPSSTDVLPSPSATWVTGGTSESCSLCFTCVETQTCHINIWTLFVMFHSRFNLLRLEVWDAESGFMELRMQLCCDVNGILFFVIMDDTTAPRIPPISFKHS